MQLVTMDSRDHAGRPGILLHSGYILDIGAAPATLTEAHWAPQSVVSVLGAGEERLAGLRALADAAESLGEAQVRDYVEHGVLLPAASTALLAPVRRPGLLLITSHDGAPAYIKSPNTAVGDATEVRVPGWLGEDALVAEAMLAVMIGRPLFRATPARVAQAIAGFTLMLDISAARPESVDSSSAWQDWVASKQFPGACPIGPALITADTIVAPHEQAIELAINDVATAVAGALPDAAALPALLARLTERYAFGVGDLVGVTAAATPLIASLRVGDELSASLGGLMRLRVTIA